MTHFRMMKNSRRSVNKCKSAQPMPLISSWEKVSQTYLQSFEKMYRGDVAVDKEVEVFQKKAETILK
ncbi:hypothetical protein OVA29_13445 [Exiguobacterium sp. SL14]|nr:hypothetical protein [Exiguobacterium sp. SL14]MCY1691567.1 hypothetical protein [Exiguobacterium sp. SL14]